MVQKANSKVARSVNTWNRADWIPISSPTTEPIFFRCLPTNTVGKLHIQFSRLERTKMCTLHTMDVKQALLEITEIAEKWDRKLSEEL